MHPHLLAVALAVVAAVLFGLSAVRQHGAVQVCSTGSRRRPGLRGVLPVVRSPAWLLGAAQVSVAGGAHLAALVLAPVTLVQPIGVVAVPVTVVAAAVAARRRPTRGEALGAGLGVLGVAALTVLLLGPRPGTVQLPGWPALATVVPLAVAATVAGTLAVRSALLRCLVPALGSAVLFGVNAILLRTLARLVTGHAVTGHLPLLATALLGMALALPVGLWAMQLAYLGGSAHVVVCCLTLVDPLVAVLGAHLLLHDGVAVGGAALTAAVGCTVVAAAGIVVLARPQAVASARSASSR